MRIPALKKETEMTKGAMGNLINRYRAILWKCHVKNAMSRMVLAGALLAAPLFAEGLPSIVGGTETAWAGKYSLDGLAQDFAGTGSPQEHDAESSGRQGTVGTEHAGNAIYGGLATTQSSLKNNSIASGNILTIQGDSTTPFSNIAVAGYAGNWGYGSSTANNNKLFIKDVVFGETQDPGLAGGFADLQTGARGTDVIAIGNEVQISGEKTKIYTTVQGGKATANNNAQPGSLARADGNKIFITGSAHVVGSVHGAQVHGNTENMGEGYAGASRNIVTVTNAFIGEADNSKALYYVEGAYVYAERVQDTYGNKVEISDSVLTGGHGDEDAKSSVRALTVFASRDPVSIKDNSVEFTDSEIDGSVSGTYIASYGGAAEASGTTVTVKGSSVGEYVLGDFVYSSGDGAAAQTTVSVSDTHVGGYVIGAYARADADSSGDAKASGAVTVKNSDIASVVYSGYARNSGSGLAEASGNTLELDDTHVSGSVAPGYARNDGSGQAVAEGNTVTLRGGTYDGSIYGSYARAAGAAASAGGNTVILQGYDVSGGGSPSFSAQSTVIWGSYALGGNQMYAPSSPNTLNIIDAKGMTAANIRNFSTVKYILPNMKAQESVLTLTGGADNEKTDISNASVSIAVADVRGRNGGEFGVGGDKSPENDRIILLKNDNGLTSDGWKQEGEITAREGVSLSFDLAAGTDDTSLYLYRPETIIDPSDPDHPHPNDTVVNPQTKALAEGWLAGLTLGIQAGNVAADQGIGAMRYAAVRLDRDGWLPFGVLEGGSLKYDSGSHIDLQSLSLLAGLGRGVSTDLGLLIVGGFFEYGTGSYKTHNTFDTMPSVDGSGNAWYMGGGLLASMDFKKTGDGHFYFEGSAHTGMLHNSFDGDALRDAYGRSAEFDTDTPYYNLHAGLGYLWNITEDHSLDIYGKYYWTRVLGTDETLNTGDHVDFDDITSSRTRLGARYAYQATEHVSTYIGAAWEHEFEGVSDSSVFGYDIDSPKIRGDSGRGEMGLRFTPTDDLPLTVDLGVQGYAGKKEGVTGSLFVQYEF